MRPDKDLRGWWKQWHCTGSMIRSTNIVPRVLEVWEEAVMVKRLIRVERQSRQSTGDSRYRGNRPKIDTMVVVDIVVWSLLVVIIQRWFLLRFKGDLQALCCTAYRQWTFHDGLNVIPVHLEICHRIQPPEFNCCDVICFCCFLLCSCNKFENS